MCLHIDILGEQWRGKKETRLIFHHLLLKMWLGEVGAIWNSSSLWGTTALWFLSSSQNNTLQPCSSCQLLTAHWCAVGVRKCTAQWYHVSRYTTHDQEERGERPRSSLVRCSTWVGWMHLGGTGERVLWQAPCSIHASSLVCAVVPLQTCMHVYDLFAFLMAPNEVDNI